MFRIIACFIAAIAASLALGTGSASADPTDDGHNEHCGHGSFPDCPPPPPDCEGAIQDPECPPPPPDCDGVLPDDENCPPPPPPPTGCQTGFNVIVGSVGNDRLPGTVCRDAIFGLGGNDLQLGRAGADRLRGGPGNDTLRGGLGGDVMNGGIGFDTCVGTVNDKMRNCERRLFIG